MKLTIRKTIGNKQYSFCFEGADLHECLMESQKISFYDLMKCGIDGCGSPHLRLYAYETKEEKYKYIKVMCSACKASLTLGQSKKDNAYYFRKDENTKALAWVPCQETNNSS